MAKRQAELTAFFRPGKAPTPNLDEPKSLFESNAERRQTVKVIKHGKPVTVYVHDCCRDGSIKGGCHNTCSNQWVDLLHFAPEDPAAHTKLVAAYDAFQAAHALDDRPECLRQLEILVKLRTDRCAKCRERKKLSPAQQACKDWYDDMRKAAALQNDGCAHAHCPVRGPNACQVLTADHGTNPKATHEVTNKKTGKVTTKRLDLSNYMAWPKVGGVPAMEAELAQIEKWICHCCHRSSRRPTRASGAATRRRCPKAGRVRTPRRLRRRSTARASRQDRLPEAAARRRAQARHRRVRHVRAPVLPGTEPAFEFNHLDEATKCKGDLFGRNGGVAGLVATTPRPRRSTWSSTCSTPRWPSASCSAPTATTGTRGSTAQPGTRQSRSEWVSFIKKNYTHATAWARRARSGARGSRQRANTPAWV